LLAHGGKTAIAAPITPTITGPIETEDTHRIVPTAPVEARIAVVAIAVVAIRAPPRGAEEDDGKLTLDIGISLPES